MKRVRTFLTAPFLLALLLSFEPRGEVLGFSPASGLLVERTYESTSRIALENQRMTANGQEIDAMAMGMEMSSDQELRLVVTDSFLDVSGGRVSRLRRTFDEIAKSSRGSATIPQMGDQDFDVSGESELEGRSVVFEWDDDAGDFDVDFAEGSDGDDELLEGLRMDLDWYGFLPEEEVEEGATWEADAELFRDVLAPGGSLSIEMDAEDMGPAGSQADPPPLAQLLGTLDGTVSCELVELTEVDGVRVARIQIEFDVESASDLKDFAQKKIDEMDRPDGMPFEIQIESVDGELTYEGAGELLWNLDAGLLHSIELSGRRTQVQDTVAKMTIQGQSGQMETSTTLGGDMTIRMALSIQD